MLVSKRFGYAQRKIVPQNQYFDLRNETLGTYSLDNPSTWVFFPLIQRYFVPASEDPSVKTGGSRQRAGKPRDIFQQCDFQFGHQYLPECQVWGRSKFSHDRYNGNCQESSRGFGAHIISGNLTTTKSHIIKVARVGVRFYSVVTEFQSGNSIRLLNWGKFSPSPPSLQ